MSRFTRFGPLLLLGLCLILAIVFRAFILSYVVQPVALSLWLAWRVVLSVDQSVYWTAIVLLCVAWIIALLPRESSAILAENDHEPRRTEVGVKRWQTLFQDAARSADGQDALRTRLRSLLSSAIGAMERGADAAALENGLRSKRISLPPEVRHYLLPSPATTKPLSGRSLGLLFSRPGRWLRSLAGKRAVPDRAAMEEFLRWMESMMETKYDQ